MKTHLVGQNVATKVDRPKMNDYRPVFLDAKKIQRLFQIVKGTRLELSGSQVGAGAQQKGLRQLLQLRVLRLCLCGRAGRFEEAVLSDGIFSPVYPKARLAANAFSRSPP